MDRCACEWSVFCSGFLGAISHNGQPENVWHVQHWHVSWKLTRFALALVVAVHGSCVCAEHNTLDGGLVLLRFCYETRTTSECHFFRLRNDALCTCLSPRARVCVLLCCKINCNISLGKLDLWLYFYVRTILLVLHCAPVIFSSSSLSVFLSLFSLFSRRQCSETQTSRCT